MDIIYMRPQKKTNHQDCFSLLFKSLKLKAHVNDIISVPPKAFSLAIIELPDY